MDKEEVPYGVGGWEAGELGNHRAVVKVSRDEDAVRVHIPWRRRDLSPEKKNIVVIDAADGKQTENVARIGINREHGNLVFQPRTVPGRYYIYYLPYTERAFRADWATFYMPPKFTAQKAWLRRHGLTSAQRRGERWKSLPPAEVLEIQARTEFHRFDPMEVIATGSETEQLIAKYHKHPYLLFPEDRRFPIRMTDDLPLRWIKAGPSNEFMGKALRGEFYVFQIGLFAGRKAIKDMDIEFAGLKGEKGKIAASAFQCINLGGIDCYGEPFRKKCPIDQGKVQAFWIGVQIPPDVEPGTYHGWLTVRPRPHKPTKVRLTFEISEEILTDSGVGDLWRMSRLNWLNSTIGIDDKITSPYAPLEVRRNTVACLGRKVRFNKTGLPESILSNRKEILAAPIGFVVEDNQGRVDWQRAGAGVAGASGGTVVWESKATGRKLTLAGRFKMEFDGYIDCRLKLQARRNVKIRDIRLEIPMRRQVAAYLMGLGHKGGYRTKPWRWIWNRDCRNNMIWMGDVDAGLYCRLKAPNDVWYAADELQHIQYNLRDSDIPSSWANSGKGGCTVTEEGDAVLVRAYSGERDLKVGEEIEFHFALLVTPVKPLDQDHWNQRYFHLYASPRIVERSGANIVNLHQRWPPNPYINYPFLALKKLSRYVNKAHQRSIKVKPYYTVRELSNYAAELWPLRSLGKEVFADGSGGGHSWLHEHLVSGYSHAWHTDQCLPPGVVDASIATTASSRWNNYYLEGLAWLLRKIKVDGIYFDGIGFDRHVMKRVRKVLDRIRPGCLVDLHSGNPFTMGNHPLSPACRYMEHFPYIDSLWFGEGYEYNLERPDYWLVEISGIPFGLFGEMLGRDFYSPGRPLKHKMNPWRGMLYGMSTRYHKDARPRRMWKLWDEFDIQNARMIGYWDPSCPVRTTHKDILATCYCKKEKVLVALASWAEKTVHFRLEVDWNMLGMAPDSVRILAPSLRGLQKQATFGVSEEIPVEAMKGWLLVIAKR